MGRSIYLSNEEILFLLRLVADVDAPETEEDAEISEKLYNKLNKGV